MSRTFRRRDAKARHQLVDWVLTDIVYADGWPYVSGWHRVRIDANSKMGKKLVGEFHRESYRFMGNAPSWYCNIFQRSARQEARRQLHLFSRNPEDLPRNRGFSVMIDPKHHHNATWAWW
jgi:hypothetical protein